MVFGFPEGDFTVPADVFVPIGYLIVCFIYAIAVGLAIAWSIACALSGRRFEERGTWLLEGLAVTMLAAALGLGRTAATLWIGLLALGGRFPGIRLRRPSGEAEVGQGRLLGLRYGQ